MGKKSSRKKPRKQKKVKQRSRLQEHKRKGKSLLPPFAQLPISPISWVKDLLPEMLWLDSVLSSAELRVSTERFHRTLDVVDGYMPDDSKQVVTGLVSSFALVPHARREDVRSLLKRIGLFNKVFPREFLAVIGNYPNCPMSWLLDGEDISNDELASGVERAKESAYVCSLLEENTLLDVGCLLLLDYSNTKN